MRKTYKAAEMERAVLMNELKLHIDSLQLHFDGISRTFDRIAEVEIKLDGTIRHRRKTASNVTELKNDER